MWYLFNYIFLKLLRAKYNYYPFQPKSSPIIYYHSELQLQAVFYYRNKEENSWYFITRHNLIILLITSRNSIKKQEYLLKYISMPRLLLQFQLFA